MEVSMFKDNSNAKFALIFIAILTLSAGLLFWPLAIVTGLFLLLSFAIGHESYPKGNTSLSGMAAAHALPGIILLSSALFSFIHTQNSWQAGPSGMLVAMTTALLFSAAFSGMCTWLAMYAHPGKRNAHAVAAAGFCLVLSFMLAHPLIEQERDDARKALANAQQLSVVGQRVFDQIAGPDGLITWEYAVQAKYNDALKAEDQAVISELCYRFLFVAHVVGRVYDGGSGISSNFYAINKNDLQTYPTRIREVYANWVNEI